MNRTIIILCIALGIMVATSATLGYMLITEKNKTEYLIRKIAETKDEEKIESEKLLTEAKKKAMNII